MTDSDPSDPHESPQPEDPGPHPELPDVEVWPEMRASRRKVLATLSLGMGGVAISSVLAPWLGLFVSPLARTDPDVWMAAGSVDDFEIGETRLLAYRDPDPLPWAGFSGRDAAWVRRDGPDEFTAFSTYCPHVGCAVRWEEGAGLFMCPCHGGAFYPDGSVAAGPPPRPLDRLPVRIHEGVVELQTVRTPSPSE